MLLSSVRGNNCTVTSYGLDITVLELLVVTFMRRTHPVMASLVKTDKLFLAYCDMEDWKGWMKIADLDTTNGGDCPKEWHKLMVNGITVCRAPKDSAGCYSTFFSANGMSYHKIRGLVRGYQKSSTDSFDSRHRKHVWTYVAGYSDHGNVPSSNCPCTVHPGPSPPSFVGEHYYCESGDNSAGGSSGFLTTDPLWDGAGCVNAKNNCCTNVGLPWFMREFPET